MDTVRLNASTVQDVLNYLANRPFVEVVKLINAIGTETMDQELQGSADKQPSQEAKVTKLDKVKEGA